MKLQRCGRVEHAAAAPRAPASRGGCGGGLTLLLCALLPCLQAFNVKLEPAAVTTPPSVAAEAPKPQAPVQPAQAKSQSSSSAAPHPVPQPQAHPQPAPQLVKPAPQAHSQAAQQPAKPAPQGSEQPAQQPAKPAPQGSGEDASQPDGKAAPEPTAQALQTNGTQPLGPWDQGARCRAAAAARLQLRAARCWLRPRAGGATVPTLLLHPVFAQATPRSLQPTAHWRPTTRTRRPAAIPKPRSLPNPGTAASLPDARLFCATKYCQRWIIDCCSDDCSCRTASCRERGVSEV